MHRLLLTTILLIGCNSPSASNGKGDMGPLPLTARSANAVMSGGVTAKSEHYKIIMSTGQPPGANGASASANHQARTGLSGATQAK
jgi:hypothetical protein